MYCLAYFVFEYTVFFVLFFSILFIFVLDVSPVLHCLIKKKITAAPYLIFKGNESEAVRDMVCFFKCVFGWFCW